MLAAHADPFLLSRSSTVSRYTSSNSWSSSTDHGPGKTLAPVAASNASGRLRQVAASAGSVEAILKARTSSRRRCSTEADRHATASPSGIAPNTSSRRPLCVNLNPGSRTLVVLPAILDAIGCNSPACYRPDVVDRASTRLEEGAVQPDAVPPDHVHAIGRRDVGLDSRVERGSPISVETLANECSDGQDLRGRGRDREHAAIAAADPAREPVPVMTGRAELPDRPVGESVDASSQFDGVGGWPRQDLQRFPGRRKPGTSDCGLLLEPPRSRGRSNTLRLSSERFGASRLARHREGSRAGSDGSSRDSLFYSVSVHGLVMSEGG